MFGYIHVFLTLSNLYSDSFYLVAQIREPPNVPQSDRVSHAGEDERDPGAPTLALRVRHYEATGKTILHMKGTEQLVLSAK